MRRMIPISGIPRKKPDSRPKAMPRASDRVTTMLPMMRESRAP